MVSIGCQGSDMYLGGVPVHVVTDDMFFVFVALGTKNCNVTCVTVIHVRM